MQRGRPEKIMPAQQTIGIVPVVHTHNPKGGKVNLFYTCGLRIKLTKPRLVLFLTPDAKTMGCYNDCL